MSYEQAIAMILNPALAPPDSFVVVAAPPASLPASISPFSGRSGRVVEWETDTLAWVAFGRQTKLIAASHLEAVAPAASTNGAASC